MEPDEELRTARQREPVACGPEPEPSSGRERVTERELTTWRSRPGRRLARTVLRATSTVGDKAHEARVAYVVLLVTSLVGLVGAALLTAASAQSYDNVNDKDGMAGLDRPLLNQMIAWRTPTRNSIVTDFTDLGSAVVMPFIAVFAALLLAWL